MSQGNPQYPTTRRPIVVIPMENGYLVRDAESQNRLSGAHEGRVYESWDSFQKSEKRLMEGGK